MREAIRGKLHRVLRWLRRLDHQERVYQKWLLPRTVLLVLLVTRLWASGGGKWRMERGSGEVEWLGKVSWQVPAILYRQVEEWSEERCVCVG